MISLLKLHDREGIYYREGMPICLLDNGVRLSACEGNEGKVILWIPETLRPQRYQFQRMCEEEISDLEMKGCLLWPEKLLYDNSGDFCGYIAAKPHMEGRFCPLNQWIRRDRTFECEENIVSALVGSNLARLFKAVRDTRQGYTMGLLSMDSFFVDEAGSVFWIETFQCVKDVLDVVKTYYVAPEILMNDSWRDCFTSEGDAFVYALMLFQILTGKFPYCSGQEIEKVDVDKIWTLMCDGESVFYDVSGPQAKVIMEILQSYSEHIRELFHKTFDYCGRETYTDGRPKIEDWMEVLSEFIRENKRMESLR